MTKHQPIPAETVLVAIDIAGVRNEVLVDVPGQRRRRLTVLNTRTEHDRLIGILASLGLPAARAPADRIGFVQSAREIIGFEPTHRRLAGVVERKSEAEHRKGGQFRNCASDMRATFANCYGQREPLSCC